MPSDPRFNSFTFPPEPISLGELFLLAILAIVVGAILFRIFQVMKKAWAREANDRRLTATRRRNCVKCDYPLDATIQGGHIRCPECGKVIERAQRRRFSVTPDSESDADTDA